METKEIKEKVKEIIVREGITILSVFVPWSKSRSFNPGSKTINDRSLNWDLEIMVKGHTILKTPFFSGLAHCPSYKQKMNRGFTLDEEESIIYETEHGKTARGNGIFGIIPGEEIKPDDIDILYCLMLDSDVLSFSSFDEWAREMGYNADSIKDKKVYDDCLKIGLSLRNGLEDKVLSELKELLQDY